MQFRVFWFLLMFVYNPAQAETPLQIMEQSYLTAKVDDSSSEITMTLSNAEGEQRVGKLISLTKLKPDGVSNMRVLRFLSPADIKGIVTLLIEQSSQQDEMWIYLPALKKTRRLVSDNKRDSFVGSDLTFGDIIGHKPSEWNHSLLREESLEGRAVYVIESQPKDEVVKNHSGYSKQIIWVDKENHLPLKTDFWDENANLLKTIHVSDVKPSDVNGHWHFIHLEAENHQNGHKTQLQLDSFQANQGLNAELFTPSNLEKDD